MLMSPHEIPFGATAPLPGHNIGGSLEPFGKWPTLDDPSMDINELKWSCSQRFGSKSLSMHWIPTLLSARHAFLSTLCISSAHDDIMRRTLIPASQRNNESLLKRLRVRQGVISLINDSINDPEMRTADETIVAVLHVLNSEVMGCDDRSMRIHQVGLHEMIRERGGLDRLGVGGQLAGILTITNYLIGAVREMQPHPDYVSFASKQDTSIPSDTSRLPESPIYCRPQGFQKIAEVLSSRDETYELLDTLRRLTNRSYLEKVQNTTEAPDPLSRS